MNHKSQEGGKNEVLISMPFIIFSILILMVFVYIYYSKDKPVIRQPGYNAIMISNN